MDINWAAGLFEGEGCISPRKGSKRVYLRVTSTDYDVLQRFLDVVKCGSIIKRKEYPDRNWKQSWEWSCGKKSEVIRLLEAFLPIFGLRRAYVALNALDYCEL